METVIWHNPRCSKSRQTLALLREHGVEPTIRLYLEEAPTVDELSFVLSKLGFEPQQLMRRGEQIFKDLDLKNVSDSDALVAAMAEHPKLIERPVVIREQNVALGRPPANVLSVIDS